jgi:ATP-dependent 26S proteasome regulatory subunit
LAEEFGRVIIFFDEIDCLAGNRNLDGGATARVLSVLLRKMDGF